MSANQPFAVNLNPRGENVLHTLPAAPGCTSGDAKHLFPIDDAEASALLLDGRARTCSRCFPLDQGPNDA